MFMECAPARAQDRARIAFDYQTANDSTMMSSTIPARFYMADQREIDCWRQAHEAFSRDHLLQVLH